MASNVFQRAGKACGEAQSLHLEAKLHYARGSLKAALRTASKARRMCRRAEADILYDVAVMQVSAIEEWKQTGGTPNQKLLRETADSLSDLDRAFEHLGDVAGRVTVLNDASKLLDLEAAVESAEKALKFAYKLDSQKLVGLSLVTAASAYLETQDEARAKLMAQGACRVLPQLEEQLRFEVAQQILEEAQALLPRPLKPEPAPREEIVSVSVDMESGLTACLREANPDWAPSEVLDVQAKLAAVEIHTATDLRRKLLDLGTCHFHHLIKGKGKTSMKIETWRALRAYFVERELRGHASGARCQGPGLGLAHEN